MGSPKNASKCRDGCSGGEFHPWQVDKAAAEKYKVDVDARGLVVLGDR